MLPDNFPVFQIELDCDFESSDNVYPTLNRVAKKPSKATEHTVIVQNETSAIFSTIGERRDNLDRVCFFLFSALSSRKMSLLSWLSLMDIVILSLSSTSRMSSPRSLGGTLKSFHTLKRLLDKV